MVTSDQRIVKISKYLSYHLRHRPDLLNLELAVGGWVEVEKLIAAAHNHNFPFSLDELKTVVKQNDKQRFSLDSTETLIRANQGHSVAVDLKLMPSIPPEILYHGTHQKALKPILQQGLRKMQRHHVHLSGDLNTALSVGKRRGKPAILKVAAGEMARAGFPFFLSNNGVWLVNYVPIKYLKLRK